MSNLTDTITSLQGYFNAALSIGIAVFLWTCGRSLVHSGITGQSEEDRLNDKYSATPGED